MSWALYIPFHSMQTHHGSFFMPFHWNVSVNSATQPSLVPNCYTLELVWKFWTPDKGTDNSKTRLHLVEVLDQKLVSNHCYLWKCQSKLPCLKTKTTCKRRNSGVAQFPTVHRQTTVSKCVRMDEFVQQVGHGQGPIFGFRNERGHLLSGHFIVFF